MNWITIKYFGRVKYFNISYAAILAIPIYIDFAGKINSTAGIAVADIPLSIRLIYLASLLYAFGIAIYQYACPKIIKDYDKVQDYIRDNFNIYITSYPDLKYNIVIANLDDLQRKSKDRLESLHKEVHANENDTAKRKELDELVNSLLPSCVQNNLTKEFNGALSVRKFWLVLSFLFYVAGTLLILFLLIKKSIVVLTFP
jgi:hypothetical protein